MSNTTICWYNTDNEGGFTLIQVMADKLESEQMLRDFLDDLNHYPSINNSESFEIADGKIVIEGGEYGLKEFDLEAAKHTPIVFHLTTGVVDGLKKVVLIERFLASAFDVEVEELVLDNLDEFSVLNDHGDWVVGAVIDDPSLFLGVFTKMVLFCNMHM